MQHILAILLLASAATTLRAETPAVEVVTPRIPLAPPPAPPALERSGFSSFSTQSGSSSQPYSIGTVTAEEQLYVELINRTRANPQAELALALANPDVISAIGFFKTDTNLLAQQYATLLPAPPLAINAKLTAATRGHVADMKTNVGQSHTGSGGSTIASRITAAGYNWRTIAENIYVAANNTLQGHYAFEVDWGNTPTGIQDPPGHRLNNHNPAYREIGVAVDYGSGFVAGWEIGPQLVAQNFGSQLGDTPIITGVCYYDLNGNNFYDVGEGIGGVMIQTTGGAQAAISANSGGYSLPVPGNGTYTVTFSLANAATAQRTVTISNQENVKIDYKPAYNAPVVSGPDIAPVGKDSTYTLSPIGGAVSYQVRQFERRPATLEGAENGTANITITTMPGYEPIVAGAAKTGSFGFHLTQLIPGNGQAPPEQIVELNPTFMIEPNSSIQFQSKLGAATLDQKARVLVSTDDGATWTVVYSQAGLSTEASVPGEQTFNARSISLAEFAGKFVKIRFSYKFEFGIGRYIPDASLTAGWIFDDILLTNGSEIFNVTTSTTSTTQLTLRPQVEATLGLQVRANMPTHSLEYGPVKFVQAALGDPEVRIVSIEPDPVFPTTRFELEFVWLSGKVPSSYTLEGRSDLNGGATWTTDSSAQISSLGNNRFSAKVTAPRGANVRFYRVKPNL